jgi:hypothetical protein
MISHNRRGEPEMADRCDSHEMTVSVIVDVNAHPIDLEEASIGVAPDCAANHSSPSVFGVFGFQPAFPATRQIP